MTLCFFVSDLHGSIDRYQKLWRAIAKERPDAVFIGGDILPSAGFLLTSRSSRYSDFVDDFLVKEMIQQRKELEDEFPKVFLILGNDDGRSAEASLIDAAAKGLWEYVHKKKVLFKQYAVFGYSYIPPSPFLLKDWEKYDVSRYVDPGSVPPEEGLRSFPVSDYTLKYSTIKKDLDSLTRNENLEKAIFLFHAPPYKTRLDCAALEGRMIDHVPLDVHVGSVAIHELIKTRQPLLTLHGHVHESPRLSHTWKERIGETFMFSAAHDGPELALIRFEPENLEGAERELI